MHDFRRQTKKSRTNKIGRRLTSARKLFLFQISFLDFLYLTLNSLKGTLLSSKIGKSTTIQEKTTFSSIYPVSCKELNSQRKVHWYISNLADMMDIGMASEIWLGLSSKSQVSIFLRKSLTRSTTTSSLNPCLSHLQLV